jgi:hypothetical protein
MRLKACSQLPQASHSFNLNYMAKASGVTEEYVENEIVSLVRRLHYKIACVAGTILTNDYSNY